MPSGSSFEALGRSEWPVSRRLRAWCGLGGALGEDGLVGDGWKHLAAGVPAPVVVGVDEPGHRTARLILGGEVMPGQQLMLERRVPALARRVIQRRADPAHRLG